MRSSVGIGQYGFDVWKDKFDTIKNIYLQHIRLDVTGAYDLRDNFLGTIPIEDDMPIFLRCLARHLVFWKHEVRIPHRLCYLNCQADILILETSTKKSTDLA